MPVLIHQTGDLDPAAPADAAVWAVTELEHPAVRDYRRACPKCLALIESAIVNARVTGSRGATFTRADSRGEAHSATVARTHGVVVA